MTSKKCNVCLQTLDIQKFPKKSGKCSDCRNAHSREKRKENRKKLIGTLMCHTCHCCKNENLSKTKRICIECFEIGKSDIEKKCTGCNLIKPSSEYYKSGRYHLYQKKCKECDNKNNLRQNSRKYTINEKYFEQIDTQEKAYILGFLYADGYNCENKGRVKITLAKKDEEILHKFKDCLETNRPLYSIKNKDGLYEELIFVNIKISDDLRKLGVVQRKTHILTFPTFLQDELIRHFIRGYFDGDGCLTGSLIGINKTYFSWRVSIVGTTNFLVKLDEILNEEININKNPFRTSHKESPHIQSLEIYRKGDVIKFLDWMYEDSKIHLDRKYKYYQRCKQGLPKYDIIK